MRATASLCIALSSSLSCEAGSAATDGRLPRIPRWRADRTTELRPVEFGVQRSPKLAEAPQYRDRLPVFRVATPSFSPLFIKTFFNVAFDANPGKVTYGQDRSLTFVKLDGSGMMVEFDHNRGRILVTNSRFREEAKHDPAGPEPSEQEATRLAQAWLTRHCLHYEGAQPVRVVRQLVGRPCYSVSFARRIAGLPYEVRGSYLEITVSRGGAFHSALIEWCDLQPIGDYPVMSLEEAVARTNQGGGEVVEVEKTTPIRGEVTKATLYYCCSPEKSGYLQPFYDLQVAAKHEGVTDPVTIRLQAVSPNFVDGRFE
ncbi:MAG: hypothetical protein FJ291_09950 [Planctomycetes bacterium]|nr:hypothetical protein [Planctomycetota bacterium]